MQYNFTMRMSQAVHQSIPKRTRDQIVLDAVKAAERAATNEGDAMIFDCHECNLKVVVQFSERLVVLMTKDEAERGGLPDRPAMHTPN